MRQLEDESVNHVATKCKFHNTYLQIKRQLQDTMKDRRLTGKAMKGQLSLEKILQVLGIASRCCRPTIHKSQSHVSFHFILPPCSLPNPIHNTNTQRIQLHLIIYPTLPFLNMSLANLSINNTTAGYDHTPSSPALN